MHWEPPKSSQNGADQNPVNPDSQKPDSTELRSFKLYFIWGTSLLLLVLLFSGGWLWLYAHTPSPMTSESVVYIPKGAGVRHIEKILQEAGVIPDDLRFPILAKITHSAEKLRAGEYLIPPQQTPLQILNLLVRGRVILHRVTIPEGKNIRQIAEILAQGDWINLPRFLALSRDSDFIKTLDLELDSLEGYLFPDTYTFTRGSITEENIISMMVKRFREVWENLEDEMPENLSKHQIITLASIVEKETGMADERPLIARVFLNRLKKNMRLQSDPTVIYGLDDFDGNLTRKDLQTPNPFNTYFIKGLPPGPICSPGRESIKAVLHPADVPYIYFVSKNDGTHHFSTSLREHNRAVRKYQLHR